VRGSAAKQTCKALSWAAFPPSAKAMQIVTGDDKVLQKCRAIGLTCTVVSSKGEISEPN
jgi:hypothetical protein